MLPAPEFKSLIAEITIIVGSAHAAVESFVRRGAVPSLDIDEVVKFLDEAGELLAKVVHQSGVVGPIFPAREAANDNDFGPLHVGDGACAGP
jgi:hypothetical protein